MKKILIAVLAFTASLAVAETDYIAMPRIDRILDGQETFGTVSATDVRTATITTTGAATLASATVTGALTSDAMFMNTTNALFAMNTVTPLAVGMFAYSPNKVVAGSDTGTLAVAVGTSTNDWVIITPDD
jgi:hypothetical protein